jgi:hypothetical protein
MVTQPNSITSIYQKTEGTESFSQPLNSTLKTDKAIKTK